MDYTNAQIIHILVWTTPTAPGTNFHSLFELASIVATQPWNKESLKQLINYSPLKYEHL